MEQVRALTVGRRAWSAAAVGELVMKAFRLLPGPPRLSRARPGRQDSGQRSYGIEDVKRLTFIRRCRDFGFPIEQVRALLQLMHDPTRDCTQARDLAQQHLTTVQAKLVELRQLEAALAAFLRTCDATCVGGPGSDCSILQDLRLPPAASASRRAAPA